MKLCLIGPGLMPIPPDGWGAVEMLIWDYFNILKSFGHEVDIINTPDRNEIINKINNGNYDAFHLHYDVFSDLMPFLNARVKIISSHYPFISFPEKYKEDGYDVQIRNITKNHDFYIFASSDNDIDTFVNFGADRDRSFLSKLGVKYDSYNYIELPMYDRTLCFSQIVNRKRQYIIQDFEGIDFFGRIDDRNFINMKNYRGEATREFLNSEITKYSNFVLLSSVENTTPLAVKESLVCGLGVVVTEPVALELDKSLDFITVISESELNDPKSIIEKIKINKEISIKKRKEIRQYGIDNFSVESILRSEYIKKIESLL
jgi:hypothetical protein